MAISQVDIVNLALNHLAVKSIASLDETSEQAQRAKLVYAPLLDQTLREYNWGFASVLTSLAQLANETATGWSYLYIYPADCLRIRYVTAETTRESPHEADFRKVISPVTGVPAVATEISPAYVEYTQRVVDPNFYDPKFVEAFSLKLAAYLAHPLTGNAAMGDSFVPKYTASVSEAKRLDSVEKKITKRHESSYLRSRG